MTDLKIIDLWNDIEEEFVSPEEVDPKELPETEETPEVIISAEAGEGGQYDLMEERLGVPFGFAEANSEKETERLHRGDD